jgi:copper(I)-binding protein
MNPKIAALFVAALGAAPAAQAATPSTVTAAGAWCRATPPSAPSAGCYVTLTARADDRLVGVDTTAADHGEIHTMDMTGGVMRMRRLADGLALPAGKAVELRPGSFHVMVIGPKRQLKAGEFVTLTLRFAKAAPLNLQVPVRDAPLPGAAAASAGQGGRQ